MKAKLSTIALLLAGLGLGQGANAAGYFESGSTADHYVGWACNPSLPNFSGWIHFYRDDNKFLGALHANIQREPGVGQACGDQGAHGFDGKVDFPYDLYDYGFHHIRGYFLGPEGSAPIELQNTAYVRFDPPKASSVSGCAMESPGPGWHVTRVEGGCYAYPGAWSQSPIRVWEKIDEYKVGATITVCSTQGMPSNWTFISSQVTAGCHYGSQGWQPVYTYKKTS